jgi:pimeloyl-ACP methyl ester carboxylesterase
MATLEAPGANLYYDIDGAGPLLVIIPGGNGAAYLAERLAQSLAARFTVVTYDRRGFARSLLQGPQDYDKRLETDADDVRRLVEHTGAERAILFGPSSGAIVALSTFTRHPSIVDQLLAYEPPALRQLDDAQQWIDFFSKIYSIYREGNMSRALATFLERTFPEPDQRFLSQMLDLTNDEMRANWTYWFEHELRQYTAVTLNLGALKSHTSQIVLAAGQASRGYLCYRTSTAIAKRLGLHLFELPGGHTGYATKPVEFADAMAQTLNRTDLYL